MVLLTELNQCLFRHFQQLSCTSPSPGTDISLDYSVSFRPRIAVRQVFGGIRLDFAENKVIGGDCIAVGMEGGEKNSVLQLTDVTGPRVQFSEP